MEAEYELAASAIREKVRAELRNRFPYVKDETLEKFSAKVEEDCNQFLVDMDSEHQDTKSRISIFSLSAELRNSIYEPALHGGDSEEPVKPQISKPGYNRPGLLATSKQIRREALPMYYANGIRGYVAEIVDEEQFIKTYADELDSDPEGMWQWHVETQQKSNIRAYLQAIGIEQARMIKSFKLLLEVTWPCNDVERMIRDGDVKDKKVAEHILEALGVLDLGVPRDSWELQKVY